VFQFHYLLADFTALENVMMPALIARMPDDEASKLAAEMLTMVGLGDKFGRRPAELSGGEQQTGRGRARRGPAPAPPARRRADRQPRSAQAAEEVHEIFHKLNRELGITLVIATHNERLMRSVGAARSRFTKENCSPNLKREQFVSNKGGRKCG